MKVGGEGKIIVYVETETYPYSVSTGTRSHPAAWHPHNLDGDGESKDEVSCGSLSRDA